MGKKNRVKKRDRTGLRSMTEDQHEDFYSRWRDIMLAVTRHGGILITGDDHEPYFKDLIERLAEDPWWTLQMFGQEQPLMMFHKAVPYDEMMVWTEERGIITMKDLIGNVGLGRYSKLGMANQEQRPWATGDGPEEGM